MKVDDLFPSDFLKSSDVDAGPIVLTIASCSMEAIGQNKETKPVVRFIEDQRGLVLNKTNSLTLGSSFGNDTDSWAGNKIELYAVAVVFQGQQKMGLRVRKAPNAAATQPVYVPGADAAGSDLAS